jgi:hypothetical protein
VSLPQGALNELRAEECEQTKDRDEHQHQDKAEGDHTLLSSFTSDVPRHGCANVTEPETLSYGREVSKDSKRSASAWRAGASVKGALGPWEGDPNAPDKTSYHQCRVNAQCCALVHTTKKPHVVPEPLLMVPMRRCRRCRDTVKGGKTAWLSNAVAMVHYLRIVNAGGRQKWHSHDHKDKAHATLPDSAWHTPQRQYARVHAHSMLPLKMLRVLPVQHRICSRAFRPSVFGFAGR